MTGVRERCFYCEDSRGNDIDHFWPKSVYPNKCFRWDNFLLACSSCNGCKGNQFPLDGAGLPLLIDPTVEDPWDFLFLEATTGQVVAKVDPGTALPNVRGQTTCDPKILPLNIESVTEGRVRVARRLARLVERFLADAVDPASEAIATNALIAELADIDTQGVVIWFFRREGQTLAPFAQMRINHAASWAQVLARIP
jgi:uncharacterized protein (TIGR02646 family)